jgi:hypothetical protein
MQKTFIYPFNGAISTIFRNLYRDHTVLPCPYRKRVQVLHCAETGLLNQQDALHMNFIGRMMVMKDRIILFPFSGYLKHPGFFCRRMC